MVSFVNKIEDKPAVNALLGSLQFFKAPLLKKNEQNASVLYFIKNRSIKQSAHTDLSYLYVYIAFSLL